MRPVHLASQSVCARRLHVIACYCLSVWVSGYNLSRCLAYVSATMYFAFAHLSAWLAVSLKPELFEGLRFDFTKPLNQNFQLCHRLAPPLFACLFLSVQSKAVCR